jgi:hypothetical protein
MQKGSVYVLVNSAQPGAVKIGKTTKAPLARAAELSSSSGVLGHFEVFSSIECEDIDQLENLAHHALRNYRVQRNREFFNITPDIAASILRNCASLLESLQAGQGGAAHQDDLERDGAAEIRTEQSEKAPEESESGRYSYKLMGNRTSPIGMTVPYNFHTRRISTKCSRCSEEFVQTLSRGEKVVRCPRCLSPQSHEVQW